MCLAKLDNRLLKKKFHANTATRNMNKDVKKDIFKMYCCYRAVKRRVLFLIFENEKKSITKVRFLCNQSQLTPKTSRLTVYCFLWIQYFKLLFVIFRWTERVSEVSLESVVDRKDKDIAKRLLAIDYNAEIAWLR